MEKKMQTQRQMKIKIKNEYEYEDDYDYDYKNKYAHEGNIFFLKKKKYLNKQKENGNK